MKRLHAGDLGQLRLRECAVRADHEPRSHRVAAVGREVPQLFVLVPDRGAHRRLEHRELVQVVTASDRAAVLEDLPSLCVVPGRDIAHLVEQREIVVRDHVACDAWVAVPVPRAPDVATALHDPDRLDADLAQTCGGQQRGEPSADEQHLDLVVDGIARDHVLDVWISRVPGEVARQLGGELCCSLGSVREAQVALLGEPLLDLVVVVLRMVPRHAMNFGTRRERFVRRRPGERWPRASLGILAA